MIFKGVKRFGRVFPSRIFNHPRPRPPYPSTADVFYFFVFAKRDQECYGKRLSKIRSPSKSIFLAFFFFFLRRRKTKLETANSKIALFRKLFPQRWPHFKLLRRGGGWFVERWEELPGLLRDAYENAFVSRILNPFLFQKSLLNLYVRASLFMNDLPHLENQSKS